MWFKFNAATVLCYLFSAYLGSNTPPSVWVRSRCPSHSGPLPPKRPGHGSCQRWPGCLSPARKLPELLPKWPAALPACSSCGTRRRNHLDRGSWSKVEARCCWLKWKQVRFVTQTDYVKCCCSSKAKRNKWRLHSHFILEQTKLWALWQAPSFHFPVTRWLWATATQCSCQRREELVGVDPLWTVQRIQKRTQL